MFQTKDVKAMPTEELRAESTRAADYIDALVNLGNSVHTAMMSCQALAIAYHRQVGHEVFLMALDVVVQTCEKRERAIAARAATMMTYIDQITELLGEEPPMLEDWPSYETLAEAANWHK